MKGKVIEYGANAGTGFIEDHRGALFPFEPGQWAGSQKITVGAEVNFRPKGSRKGPFAAQIVPVQDGRTAKTEEVPAGV